MVISGPSGVGKNTIIDRLRTLSPDYRYVVTCTTRSPRLGEIDGQSYHFLSPAQFAARRQAGAFLEWAPVHGHLYGTPGPEVDEGLAAGQVVVLNINVDGAAAVKAVRVEAYLIFLVPPSMESLLARLRGRATEAPAQLAQRSRAARLELARAGEYDRVVRNDDGQVEQTAAQIAAIIAAQRSRSRS